MVKVTLDMIRKANEQTKNTHVVHQSTPRDGVVLEIQSKEIFIKKESLNDMFKKACEVVLR